MNLRRIFKLNIFAFASLLLSYSCSNSDILGDEDDISVLSGDTEVNKWLHTTMSKNYYWLDEIKSFNNYSVDAKPEVFFYSLISSGEKKQASNGSMYCYSYIKDNNVTKVLHENENTYGIEFTPYSVAGKRYDARIMYVLPDSPAEKSGLKRGMWISKINNELITEVAQLRTLLSSGGEKELTIIDYKAYDEGSASAPEIKNITLSPSINMNGNPIIKDAVISLESENIGYLAYAHFTTGPNDYNDKTYDNQLVDIFSEFKKANVSKLIIDLRYNPGGYVESCRHLASLMARPIDVDSVICKITHNPKTGIAPTLYKISNVSTSNKDISGIKLNTTEIYFLMTEYSASASEALINGFRAFTDLKVVTIGTKSEGKNLSSQNFKNEKLGWEIQPITGKTMNKNNNGDYFNGLNPDKGFEYDEFDTEKNGLYWGELGTEDDKMISLAIQEITKKEVATYSKAPKYSSFDNKTIYIKEKASIERKKINSCIE